MNSRKRNRLKAKRTPWLKSRYSRKARAIQRAMRRMVLMQGLSQMNTIRIASTRSPADKANKAMAVANCAIDVISAVSKVPLYGGKTV